MLFRPSRTLFLALLAATAGAGAQTINFDGVTTAPDALIPNGYGGFDWNNFYVASPALLGPPYSTSGYENGLHGGKYVGFNGYGNPSKICTVGNTMSIHGFSGYFTAGWTNDDVLTITGLCGTKVIQTIQTGLVESGPKFLDITFSAPVSAIQFSTFSPTTTSSQMVLSDFTINPPATPETASLATLGFGVGACSLARRRRLRFAPSATSGAC